LTTAVAPLSRANSTSRLEKISTSTSPMSAVASRMNCRRSSALNSVFDLRTGWLTMPTMTRSKTRAALVMMSM
jgi:hypothetical protein